MSAVIASLPLLFWGALNALLLMLVSLIASTLIGSVLAIVDIWGPRWLRWPIRTFSWIGRGLPPLLVLFAAFYLTTAAGWRLTPMAAAIMAFTFFAAAYNFEIIRSGLLSVSKGQFEAAAALGIPFYRILLNIFIPQSIPLMAPSYISHATVLLKETSLASAISVLDIMGAVHGLMYSAGNPLGLMLMASLFYIAINGVLILAEARFAARLKK